MPTYLYIAKAEDGTLKKGEQKAKSIQMARQQLRRKGLTVEQLQEKDHPEEVASFMGQSMPWTATDETVEVKQNKAPATAAEYIPLQETVALFAGWLLAWYGLVYTVGNLQWRGKISQSIPFIEGLFRSPLVLHFAFGTFTLLLLLKVHKHTGKGVLKGVLLSVVWALVVFLYVVNVA